MKKRIVLLIILFFVLAGGAVFLYLSWQKGIEIHQARKGSPDDYQILETEEGKWIVNEKAGFRAKVPDGWLVEKINVLEGSVVMYSPDAEGIRPGKVRPPLKKGCLMEVVVGYKKMDLKQLREEAIASKAGLTIRSEELREVTISGHLAVENSFDSLELGPSLETYVLNGDRFYAYGISASTEDQEKCYRQFDEFLKTLVFSI